MIGRHKRRVAIAAALIGIAALPLLGDRLRSHAGHCAFDGVTIPSGSRVRVFAHGGVERRFCGVTCAANWIRTQSEAPDSVLVFDGVTGEEFDAAKATFVDSLEHGAQTAGQATDSLRVFRSRGEAERHVAAYGGTLLAGDASPFASRRP